MTRIVKLMAPLLAAAVAGCAAYTWTSAIPQDMRTVSVPTFRNQSNVTELGNVLTRQVLREFQREGTMKIAAVGESAYEVQGTVVAGGSTPLAYDIRKISRDREYRLTVMARVSVIDKVSGKVVIDNRTYQANAGYLASSDRLTPERDASGRAAEEIARMIVDDVTAANWSGDDKTEIVPKPLEVDDYEQ